VKVRPKQNSVISLKKDVNEGFDGIYGCIKNMPHSTEGLNFIICASLPTCDPAGPWWQASSIRVKSPVNV
jgi:hypothetical protein